MFTRNHTADKPGHRTGYNLQLIGDPRMMGGFYADKVTILGDTVTFHDCETLVAEFRLSQIAGYRVFHKPLEA